MKPKAGCKRIKKNGLDSGGFCGALDRLLFVAAAVVVFLGERCRRPRLGGSTDCRGVIDAHRPWPMLMPLPRTMASTASPEGWPGVEGGGGWGWGWWWGVGGGAAVATVWTWRQVWSPSGSWSSYRVFFSQFFLPDSLPGGVAFSEWLTANPNLITWPSFTGTRLQQLPQKKKTIYKLTQRSQKKKEFHTTRWLRVGLPSGLPGWTNNDCDCVCVCVCEWGGSSVGGGGGHCEEEVG